MPDRGIVIKGLECHITPCAPCAECPYNDKSACDYSLWSDILELLNKQENEYENGFNDCLALMEEQKAEPKKVLMRVDGNYCPHCSSITSRAMGVQRLIRGTRFCPYCGKPVKWLE